MQILRVGYWAEPLIAIWTYRGGTEIPGEFRSDFNVVSFLLVVWFAARNSHDDVIRNCTICQIAASQLILRRCASLLSSSGPPYGCFGVVSGNATAVRVGLPQ